MLSNEQRAARRRYVGASDVAAILGLYGSAADVWARITDRLIGDARPNEAMIVGSYLEHAIIDYYRDQMAGGSVLDRDVMLMSADGIRVANLDAVYRCCDGTKRDDCTCRVIEVKTVGLFGGAAVSQWGSPGDGDWGVPMHVLCQVHQQMDLFREVHPGCQAADVVALIAGRGIVRYRVPYSERLAAVIRERVQAFWRDHVIAGVMPDDVPMSDEVLRLLRRPEGKSVPVAAELITRALQARDESSAASARYEEIKSMILRQLGDAETGFAPTGSATFRNGRLTIRAAKAAKEKCHE